MRLRPACAIAIASFALSGVRPAPAAAFWRLVRPAAYPTAQEQFEYAASLEKAGDLTGAMDAYQRLVDAFGDSPLAAEAQFRVAEMLEKTKRYYPAFNAYQAVLDKFPSYPKVNLILERQFKIANLFLKGTEVGFLKINPSGSLKRAIAAFGKLLSNAPFSELAPNAQYNLGLAYLERKNYTEAAIEFEKIVARYPRSDFVAAAKYQLGVCAYRQALAAPYDQEAAREAITRLTDYLAEFPSDKSAEPAKEMIHELQGKKAGALYQIGCYYQERNNPKAALIYLREVIKDYPLTRYGEKARRVAQREERKLEFSEAVAQARDAVNEIERLIASQRTAIGRIKGRGRSRWTFWRYVLPRRLTPEERLEVEERSGKVGELRARLAAARLDMDEKIAHSRNRAALFDAEAYAEKTEETLRTTQLELQVAQNKLSEIGTLPEAAGTVVENAARSIAEIEERCRRQEAELERRKAGLGDIEKRCAAEETRIRERYARQRAALSGKSEEGETAAPGKREGADAAAPAPPPARRWPWQFWGAVPRGGDAGAAGREEAFREAEEMVEYGERLRLERKWAEALGAFDRASLKLMGVKNAWPDFKSGEVLRQLQRCREGLMEARQESVRDQYAELSAELETRLKKDPNDAAALLSLGVIRNGRGDARGAIECLRRAVALRPDNAEAWHRLGIATASAGDLKSAALCLRKAVERSPGDARVLHDLGLIQWGLGDYTAARAAFEEAIGVDPSFAPALFSLGRLYQSALSDRAKAADCWERYLGLTPDAPEAARIREWIDRQRGLAELRASTAPGDLLPAGRGGGWLGGLLGEGGDPGEDR